MKESTLHKDFFMNLLSWIGFVLTLCQSSDSGNVTKTLMNYSGYAMLCKPLRVIWLRILVTISSRNCIEKLSKFFGDDPASADSVWRWVLYKIPGGASVKAGNIISGKEVSAVHPIHTERKEYFVLPSLQNGKLDERLINSSVWIIGVFSHFHSDSTIREFRIINFKF